MEPITELVKDYCQGGTGPPAAVVRGKLVGRQRPRRDGLVAAGPRGMHARCEPKGLQALLCGGPRRVSRGHTASVFWGEGGGALALVSVGHRHREAPARAVERHSVALGRANVLELRIVAARPCRWRGGLNAPTERTDRARGARGAWEDAPMLHDSADRHAPPSAPPEAWSVDAANGC